MGPSFVSSRKEKIRGADNASYNAQAPNTPTKCVASPNPRMISAAGLFRYLVTTNHAEVRSSVSAKAKPRRVCRNDVRSRTAAPPTCGSGISRRVWSAINKRMRPSDAVRRPESNAMDLFMRAQRRMIPRFVPPILPSLRLVWQRRQRRTGQRVPDSRCLGLACKYPALTLRRRPVTSRRCTKRCNHQPPRAPKGRQEKRQAANPSRAASLLAIMQQREWAAQDSNL